MQNNSSLYKEYKETSILLKLAIPLILSGLVSAAMNFFSTLFLAHLGHQALAAGAIVIWLFATLMVIVWGTLSSVSILVAQKHGEQDDLGISLILKDGIFLAFISFIPATLLLWNIGPLLLLLGQSLQF